MHEWWLDRYGLLQSLRERERRLRVLPPADEQYARVPYVEPAGRLHDSLLRLRNALTALPILNKKTPPIRRGFLILQHSRRE